MKPWKNGGQRTVDLNLNQCHEPQKNIKNIDKINMIKNLRKQKRVKSKYKQA